MQFDKRKKKRLLWWNVKRSKIAPPENCINVAEENCSRIKRRGNKYWEWLKKKCIRKNVEIDKAKSFANHIDNISLLNPLPLRPLLSHKFDTHCIMHIWNMQKLFARGNIQSLLIPQALKSCLLCTGINYSEHQNKTSVIVQVLQHAHRHDYVNVRWETIALSCDNKFHANWSYTISIRLEKWRLLRIPNILPPTMF